MNARRVELCELVTQIRCNGGTHCNTSKIKTIEIEYIKMKERKLVVLLKSGSNSAYLAIIDRMIRRKSNAIFPIVFRHAKFMYQAFSVWCLVSGLSPQHENLPAQ